MKRWLGLFLALIFGSLALGAGGLPNSVVEARVGGWYSFDPAWAYDLASWEVMQNTYETLVFYNGSSTDSFIPLLSATVPSRANGLISADGLTYKFPIRKGVRFQNGDPLTAEDVVYSIRRVMVMDTSGGPAWLLLEPLLGVGSMNPSNTTWNEIVSSIYADGDTVVVHLKQPFAPLLSVLAIPVADVVDQSWAVKHGAWNGMESDWKQYVHPKQSSSYLNSHINGTGPFILSEYVKSKRVILKRFDGYWRAPAKLSYVAIENIPSFNTRRLMLQNGDANLIAAQRSMESQLQGIPGVRVVDNLPELDVEALFMNESIVTAGNRLTGSGKLDGNGIPGNFFSNVNLRRAFAYSFGYRTYIQQVELGKAVQLGGPIPKGLLGYSSTLPKYTYDPAVAKKFFKAAWGGKVWKKGFRFTALYNTGNENRHAALQILQANLQSLNPKFRMEIQPVQWAMVLQLARSHQATMWASDWLADYADPYDFVQPFYASTGALATRYAFSNQEMDKLIARSVEETVPEQRLITYQQIHHLGYQLAPAIFIDQPTNFQVMRTDLTGWYYNPILFGTYYYPVAKKP